MQSTKTFLLSEPALLSPKMDPVISKPVVAHPCQAPGALHFYASDVCIFCHEHRAPWRLSELGGDAASPSYER